MEFTPLDFSFGQIDMNIDKRIHKPKKIRSFKDSAIAYENAEKLAKELKIGKGERYFTFIAGNFVFGDFIEAFCTENDLFIKKMTISTLSMSEINVDSLANLLINKFVNKLDLIVSDYFYSNERHKIVKYIYQELDIDNRFQLVVARSHTKICTFETYDGMKYVIHGSANLRSSDNIEQFDIEENEFLHDYIDEFHSKITEQYKTINKKVGGQKLWHQVGKDQEVKQEKQKEHLQKDVKGSKEDETAHRFKNPKF